MSTTRRNTNMDKNKILKGMKADLRDAETARQEHDARIREWKDAYNGKKYGNEVKGKSEIVSRDIKKQDEWLHPSILDPFVSTPDIVKVTPITYEDVHKARQSELLLNYQFCRQFQRFSFMTKALKILSQEGTLVVQTGWEYRDEKVRTKTETIEVINGVETVVPVEIEETKILVNKPTAVVCRNEDIYMDPTCMDNMDNCQFIIHRYETDYSTLKQDGRYKNIDKVMRNAMSDSPQNDGYYIPEDDTYFKFQDNPRKKLMIYEYWGNYDIDGSGIAKPIVCAWIGDVIVRLQDNPYPDKKIPFMVVPFNSVPFQMFGESDAELIGDNQKIKTAVTRGIIDNMAQSNNGQTGVRKGALDVANRQKFLNDENFEFNGTPNDFWYGSYNQIPRSAFDMLTVQSNEIESQTGVKSFSGGINGGSISGSATGVRGALSATAVRRMYRVRNVSENLIKPMMRKWLSYSAEFMSDTEVMNITNSEFVKITKDDLTGRVDLDIEVATAEDNAQKSQELSFMMQTTAQSMDPDMKFDLMADWAALAKMPESAKRLRDKAEKVRQQMNNPDPTQERMKQAEVKKAELENKKLEAQIFSIYATGKEDEADQRMKMAKALVDEAKAKNLHSATDMQNLNYIKTDGQIDEKVKAGEIQMKHNNDMQKEMLKHKANMEQMKYQQQAGDTQIGVVQ